MEESVVELTKVRFRAPLGTVLALPPAAELGGQRI